MPASQRRTPADKDHGRGRRPAARRRAATPRERNQIMKNAMKTGTHAAEPTGIRHTWTSADGPARRPLMGRPDGAPVILLHGSGQTRHAWSGMGRLLGAAGFHAVAFDARGHGESDWSPTCNYSLGAMILDLERVAAMFDGRRPIVVGALGGGRACSPSAKAISRRRRSCSSTSRPASNQRARCACSRSCGSSRTVSGRWTRRPTLSATIARIRRKRSARKASRAACATTTGNIAGTGIRTFSRGRAT